MNSIEFLTTATTFSMLGYALCYLTLSSKIKSKTEKTSDNPNQEISSSFYSLLSPDPFPPRN